MQEKMENKEFNNKVFSAWRLLLTGWMLLFATSVFAQTTDTQTPAPGQVQTEKPDASQTPINDGNYRGNSFSALDLVLQKPAKNEKFSAKRFGDRLFFTGEGGITMHRLSQAWFRTPGIGERIGFTVGDWFTPVHGLRFGVNGGWRNGDGAHDYYYTGVSLDYLMNLTSLLRKDNPSRLFELIGVAGLEYQAMKAEQSWNHIGGARLGVQARLNFSPLTFFYVEPRFGIYSDNVDNIATWRKWDWEASLMAGFGYRLLSDPIRKHHAFLGKGRNLFFTGGAGISALLSDAKSKSGKQQLNVGAAAILGAGLQFTRVSSVRLLGTFQNFSPNKKIGETYKKTSLGLQLDYMFNMHSIFGGYDPDRLFELSGVLGGGLDNISMNFKQDVYWNVGAGLHGDFRLTDHWSAFIEPRLDYFFKDGWKENVGNKRFVPSLLAGVTYYPVSKLLERINKGEEVDLPSPLGDVYITAGGGFAGILRSSFSEPFKGKGYRLSAGVGTQFTSLSGARLLANFSSIDNPSEMDRTLAIGGQLDYVLHLSNLFWGNKPSRIFNLNGMIGVNYDYLSFGDYCQSVSGGVGLQGTFRIGEMFDLYLEPRLNVGANNRWERGAMQIVDMVPTIMAGVNYNLYGYRRMRNISRANEPFSKDGFFDHTFAGITVGANTVLHRKTFTVDYLEYFFGPIGSIYAGKWFTPASGLRLWASAALYGESKAMRNFEEEKKDPTTIYTYNIAGERFRKLFIADISYLWNINSTLFGYKPTRIFETTLGVGASVAYSNSKHKGFYPGVNLSLQGMWKLTPSLGLFVEPQLRFFGEKFTECHYANLPIDIHTSLQAGLQCIFDGYEPTSNRAAFKEHKSKCYLSTGYAISALNRDSVYSAGHGASLAFGKWSTPVSGWRLSVDYEYHNYRKPRYMSLALSADYLFNFSAYEWGYNPHRVFDLLAVAGVSFGVNNTRQTNGIIWGVRTGLQGRFNLSPTIDLFIEPQLLAMRIPKRGFTPEPRLVAGLNYKLGKKEDDVNHNKEFKKKNFVTVSGGASMFSESILWKTKVSTAFDVSYGRWFSPSSGIQVGYGADLVKSVTNKTTMLNSVRLDYLLNFTSLFDANPERRFDLIGIAGAGFGWSKGKKSWLGEGRLQFRWNVSRVIGLYLEPSMTVWSDKIYNENSHNFVGVGRLSAGLAVRF